MLEGAYIGPFFRPDFYDDILIELQVDGMREEVIISSMLRYTAYRGTLNGIFNFSTSLRGYAGFGVENYSLEYKIMSDSQSYGFYPDAMHIIIYIDAYGQDRGGNLFVPFINLGIEWRPWSRLGVALFGNYRIGELENVVRIRVDGWEADVSPSLFEQEFDIFKLQLPMVSLDTTFSLYF